MSMFSRQAYPRIMALRATSAGSWAILVSTLFAAALSSPPSWVVLVGACAFLVWIATAPCAISSFFVGMKRNLREQFARTRTTYVPWDVVRLAKKMNAPIPRQLKVITSNRTNAGTDGFTLLITSAMERELLTSAGKAVIAHELAHAKSRHSLKKALVVVVAGTVAWLFGEQFWALHEAIGIIMGVAAFLTLISFASPLVSRRMEYDADALASAVVGSRTMATTLQSLVPSERWDIESDSHPSIQARVQRLRRIGD